MKKKRMLAFTILASSVALSAPVLAQTTAPGSGQATPRPSTAIQPAKPSTGQHDWDRQGPQAFSVVLVLGDMQGTTAADDVPMAARKALADMKDFLPYKSYRLLDAQWSLCCGRSPLASRLRGADGQEYDLELNASVVPVSGGRAPAVSVRFQLTEAAAAGYEGGRADTATESAAAAELRNQIKLVEHQLVQVRDAAKKRSAVGAGVEPDRDPAVMETERRLADLKIKLAQVRDRSTQTYGGARKFGHRPVIDTSFRMDVGETVVVGTSRVKGGDKALIALLTAVPQKTTGTR